MQGSRRKPAVVYGASIHRCRPCPLREQRILKPSCIDKPQLFHMEWRVNGRMTFQWNGGATKKPRRVSVLLHPLAIGSGPLLWRDGGRSVHRRTHMQLLGYQHAEIHMTRGNGADPATPRTAPALLSRADLVGNATGS